jgi:adenylate cyclase
MRVLLGRLPHDPRCKFCHAPFEGVGGALVRTLLHKRPSQYNTQLCTMCEEFVREHPGGAEVELSMLFADVRGSTTLAEGMRAAEFSRLIDRFYQVASRVLIESDALIEKLIGDSVTGLFFPGISGPDYAARAVHAARTLLQVTGHSDSNGPWVPLGIGVHHGTAFAGSVGSADGVTGFTALGDAVNVAARLASHAGAGEIVVSEAACARANLDTRGLEQRQLTLKGRSGTAAVRVLRADGGLR